MDLCLIYFTEAQPDRQGEALPLGTVQRWVPSGKAAGGLLWAGLIFPALLTVRAHPQGPAERASSGLDGSSSVLTAG